MRRWLRFLPILFAAIAVGWVYLTSETFVNPETGRKSHVGLSEAQEQQLGLQGFREVVSHSSIVQSGPAYDVVRRVASRLIRVVDTGSEQYQWQVAVVQNPAQNAFCLPGGKLWSTRVFCLLHRTRQVLPLFSDMKLRMRPRGM